jgi:uncharacterized membrane protein
LKIATKKIKPKRNLGALEITLLAIGSPIWFSMLVAIFAVIISLFASIFAICVSLWAVFISFVATALSCTVIGVVFIFNAGAPIGFATIAAGLVLAGLSIFTFIGCRVATKGIILLIQKVIFAVKRCFVGKEAAVNE